MNGCSIKMWKGVVLNWMGVVLKCLLPQHGACVYEDIIYTWCLARDSCDNLISCIPLSDYVPAGSSGKPLPSAVSTSSPAEGWVTRDALGINFLFCILYPLKSEVNSNETGPSAHHAHADSFAYLCNPVCIEENSTTQAQVLWPTSVLNLMPN